MDVEEMKDVRTVTQIQQMENVMTEHNNHYMRLKSLDDDSKEITEKFHEAKQKAEEILRGFIRMASKLQSRLLKTQRETDVLEEAWKKVDQAFFSIKCVHNIPSAYAAAVEEVHRRAAWKKYFAGHLQSTSQLLHRLLSEEYARRMSFSQNSGNYLLHETMSIFSSPFPSFDFTKRLDRIDPLISVSSLSSERLEEMNKKYPLLDVDISKLSQEAENVKEGARKLEDGQKGLEAASKEMKKKQEEFERSEAELKKKRAEFEEEMKKKREEIEEEAKKKKGEMEEQEKKRDKLKKEGEEKKDSLKKEEREAEERRKVWKREEEEAKKRREEWKREEEAAEKKRKAWKSEEEDANRKRQKWEEERANKKREEAKREEEESKKKRNERKVAETAWRKAEEEHQRKKREWKKEEEAAARRKKDWEWEQAEAEKKKQTWKKQEEDRKKIEREKKAEWRKQEDDWKRLEKEQERKRGEWKVEELSAEKKRRGWKKEQEEMDKKKRESQQDDVLNSQFLQKEIDKEREERDLERILGKAREENLQALLENTRRLCEPMFEKGLPLKTVQPNDVVVILPASLPSISNSSSNSNGGGPSDGGPGGYKKGPPYQVLVSGTPHFLHAECYAAFEGIWGKGNYALAHVFALEAGSNDDCLIYGMDSGQQFWKVFASLCSPPKS
uniref:Autophagy protein ATG17-like domain-containing protein n=1 Tax=Paramoeba aestuarina TaxID=180227 RepID=A0A7S4P5Y3_9EUKA